MLGIRRFDKTSKEAVYERFGQQLLINSAYKRQLKSAVSSLVLEDSTY